MLDLTGRTFGRWHVLGEGPSRITGRKGCRDRYWFCRCSCGTRRLVYQGSLITGGSHSCGCYSVAVQTARHTTHGHALDKEVQAEYRAWGAIKARCYNPRDSRYPDYGGRGIKMCDQWHNFAVFLSDMGRKPSPQHSLDRIDVNGGYEPGNCRWADSKTQQNNRRCNRMIEYDGRKQTLSQWASELELSPRTLYARLSRCWSVEKALTIPSLGDGGRRLTYDGKTLSIVEWAKEMNLPLKVISMRLWHGWNIERALTEPVQTRDQPYTHNDRTMTLAQWAAELGLTTGALYYRLKTEWSIERALTTPAHNTGPRKK